MLFTTALLKIDEIYAKLEGSTIYSTFDMRSGYYHLELNQESQPKSAFVIGGPKGGKWEFKRCPFGLTQAPAYFQMLVNKVFEGLDFTFGYLDDILVFSKNMEEHLQHVRILFERLHQADLKLTKRKCNFSQGTCTVPRTLHIWTRARTNTRKVGKPTGNASTHRSDKDKKILRICRIL